MVYQIKNTRGQVVSTVSDYATDNSTSLELIGRGVSNYGLIEQSNLLHLLENFASPTEPSNPVEGQLWFNTLTSNKVLSVYYNNTWNIVATQLWAESNLLRLHDTENQTVTGPVTFSGTFSKDAPVGSNSQIQITAGGSDRWNFGRDADAESGTSNGSNFVIARFDNSGNYIDSPFGINRNTGVVSANIGMTVPDITKFDGTDALNARTADKRYVKNNAGTSGGIIALDLDGNGSGDLSYQRADGSWGTCQPVGDYATKRELNDGLATKQPVGDYATNTALIEGLATKQPVGDYATNTALNDVLSTTQPVGDYATKTELNNGLATKQPVGDYATKTELNNALIGKENAGVCVPMSTYNSDFGTSDSQVINLPYGHRIQFVNTGTVHGGARINFPIAFSGTPVVVGSPYQGSDDTGHPYSADSSGFYVHSNGGGSLNFSYIAIGPK